MRFVTTEADAALVSGDRREVETAADPVRSALAQPSAVIVAPARDEAQALVVTVRNSRARQAQEVAPERNVREFEATGFLGLQDEAVYEEEQPKSWWRRKFGKQR